VAPLAAQEAKPGEAPLAGASGEVPAATRAARSLPPPSVAAGQRRASSSAALPPRDVPRELPLDIFRDDKRLSEPPAPLLPTPVKHAPAAVPATGQGAIGPYRVLREIGVGGMALVYQSVQETLKRPVALKLLRAEIAGQAALVERFEREAVHLAMLQHENVVHIYDYRLDGPQPYMVIEYLEGVDLYDILQRHGRVPEDVALVVGYEVARALDYVHNRDVIHRDIKPANVMLTAQGGVKVMDFGIARLGEKGDLTEAGSGVGTPAFMSPEQVVGDPLDGRTDLWSLGVVLYHLVTGRKPFQEDGQQTVLQKIRLETPPPPRVHAPDLSPDTEQLVLRCLEKSPAARYATAQQLVVELEKLLLSRGIANHRAHLLQYLQTIGELTAEQARAAMPPEHTLPARRPEPRGPEVAAGSRWRFPFPVTQLQALVAGGLVLALLLVILLLAVRPGSRPSPQVAPPAPAADRAPPGATPTAGLRVVAHPWAEVWVDGKRVETTPFDQPVALPAGTHQVLARHPKLGEMKQQVVLRSAQVASWTVDLAARQGSLTLTPATAPASSGGAP
jgi:serine/threonine-protein kinase